MIDGVSESFPYFYVAREWQADYGAVLQYVDHFEGKITAVQITNPLPLNVVRRIRRAFELEQERRRGVLIEVEARRLAARKMGLASTNKGEYLPEDLWRQCIPEARGVVG